MPTSQGSSRKVPSVSLLVSLVANVVLVFALLLRGGKHNPDQPKGTSVVSEMTESDAREKWEAEWKSEWEKSLPPPAPAMTESDAKAKWEALWKSEWEKALPPPTPDMTEEDAKAKWEEIWRKEWIKSLRSDFNSTLKALHGEWPVPLDDEKSPFLNTIRDADVKPEAEEAAALWTLYRSCKACTEFITNQLHP